MKAILEFNLPEEHAEHIRAVHAMDAWAALYSIRDMIRSHRKNDYSNPEYIIEQISGIVLDAEILLGE